MKNVEDESGAEYADILTCLFKASSGVAGPAASILLVSNNYYSMKYKY